MPRLRMNIFSEALRRIRPHTNHQLGKPLVPQHADVLGYLGISTGLPVRRPPMASAALVVESVVQGLWIPDVRVVLELEILAFAFLPEEEIGLSNSPLHIVPD